MNFIDFVQFVKTQCMYETIYEDSDGNLILVTRMLDAYTMANKLVEAERESKKYEDIITNMAKLLEMQQKREGVAVDMIEAAILAEREACSSIASDYAQRLNSMTAVNIADAIRARGQA
jgi:K+-sensing histidine kinase KdpD